MKNFIFDQNVTPLRHSFWTGLRVYFLLHINDLSNIHIALHIKFISLQMIIKKLKKPVIIDLKFLVNWLNANNVTLNTKNWKFGNLKFGKFLWRIWKIKSSAFSLNLCLLNQLTQVTTMEATKINRRSSQRRCTVKKVFLEISQNSL